MKLIKYILIPFFLFTFSIQLKAQLFGDSFDMDNNDETTCDAKFYDSGGSMTGNIGAVISCIAQNTYSNNEDFEKTICSETGENIRVIFDNIELVGADDYLEVYDGSSTADPLMATITSSNVPMTDFIGSGDCLTFVFHSGDNGTGLSSCDDGGNWSAAVSCVEVHQIDNPDDVATCDAVFVDDGGLSGDYSGNQSYVKTFCPDGGNCSKLNFTMLDLGPGETLTFYSGNTASGAPLATLTEGDPIPQMGVGSNPGECLTVKFDSDGTGEGAGWQAVVFCPPTCGTPPECATNPSADNQCETATPICNLDGFCGNTSGDYDPLNPGGTDWDEVEGLEFCGTIENNSWLSFVASESSATLNVWTYDCENNQGIQMQIYETSDCENFTAVSNCMSIGTPTDFQIQADALVPGETYYLMIDGFANDVCEYIIAASSGVATGAEISADQEICPGWTAPIEITNIDAATGSVTWTANPPDASLAGQENNASITVSPDVTTEYTAQVSAPSGNPDCPPIDETFVTHVEVVDADNPACQVPITCELDAFISDTLVCPGDPVEVTASGYVRRELMANTFDDGTIGVGWNGGATANFSDPCSDTPPYGTNYCWMDNTTSAPRTLTTNDFNVSEGAIISFWLRMSEEPSNTAPCEGPDEPDEGVALQYSIDNGVTWDYIIYFNPQTAALEATNPQTDAPQRNAWSVFNDWERYSFDIPVAAQTTSTRFRWFQEHSTDEDTDNWGIDSVLIIVPPPVVIYNWTSNPPGFTATGEGVHTVNPTVPTWYYVELMDEDSLVTCVDSVFVDIRQFNAGISIADTAQCLIGNNFDFSFSGVLDTGMVVNWDFGDGNTATGEDVSHQYTSPGTYDVVQEIVDGSCVDTETQQVVVHKQPEITFGGNAMTCIGECTGTATVTPSGANPATPFAIDWSVGNPGTGPTANDLCAGSFVVTFTDANGCVGVDSSTVGEYADPAAEISGVTMNCYGLCEASALATITAASPATPYTYQWSSGNPGTGQTVTDLCSGEIAVTFTDANGCKGIAVDSVQEYGDISITLTPEQVHCHGEANGSVTASASGGAGAPYSYEWSNNANGQTGPTITGLRESTYYVTATDAYGCSNSLSTEVIEPEIFKLETSGNGHLCYGEGRYASVLPIGGTSPYTFTWNGQLDSNSVYVRPLQDTVLNIYAVDKYGCDTTASITYTVDDPIIVTAYSPNDTICPGDEASITIVADGGAGSPYMIYIEDNIVSSPAYVYPQETTTYMVYARDRCGRYAAKDSVEIAVYPAPKVEFSADEYEGCQPFQVSFREHNEEFGDVYLWDFGDGLVNNTSRRREPGHLYEGYGVYDVKLIIKSADNCTAEKVWENMITVYKKPLARFTPEPTNVSIIQPVIQFENYSQDAVTYYWSFDDGDSSDFVHPEHVFPAPGEYDIMLVAESNKGCKDTVFNPIKVRPEYTFYAPNAFSPNKDQVNDVWNVTGVGISPDNFNLKIYDRWGEIIYETDNSTKGWDGSYNGRGETYVPNGTYTWVVIFRDLTGYERTESGSVTVIY